MAILQTDILLKTMIEAALNDLRANEWILDHIFEGLATDPLARREYGYKEVESAKKWFAETDIPVLLQHRIADKPPMPCISIAYESSSEALDRASLADEGQVVSVGAGLFVPDRALSEKFTPIEYNSDTGLVTLKKDTLSYPAVIGQYLTATCSGKAYEVKKVVDVDSFYISPGIKEDFMDSYIRSKFGCWNVHEGVSFFNERYSIGVWSSGDVATCQWLWQIVIYSLLRYKEAFLEERLFELSTFQSGPYEARSDFGADHAYARFITFSGVVPATFVKMAAPRIEAVGLDVVIADGPSSPPGTYDTPVEDADVSWVVDGDYNNYTQTQESNAPVDDDVLVPPSDKVLPEAIIFPNKERCEDDDEG